MNLTKVDFSSTHLRRAATALGILSLVTAIVLVVLACQGGNFLDTLKREGVTQSLVGGSALLGGYLFSHIFLSKNKHKEELGSRSKIAGRALALVLGISLITLVILAKTQDESLETLLKQRNCHLTLAAVEGCVIGGLLGFLFSQHEVVYIVKEEPIGSFFLNEEEVAERLAAL